MFSQLCSLYWDSKQYVGRFELTGKNKDMHILSWCVIAKEETNITIFFLDVLR